MHLKLLFENELRIVEIRYTDIDPIKDWPPKPSSVVGFHDEDDFGHDDAPGDKGIIRTISNGAMVYEYQPGEYDQPKRIVVYPTGAVKCYKDWTDFERSELYPAFLGGCDNVKPFEEKDYTEFKHVFNSLCSQI